MTEHDEDSLTPEVSGPTGDAGAELSSGVPQIDGYDILGKLSGVGGQGAVWRAKELAATGREVALKFPRAGPFSSERDLARFEREVELTSRLEHPNIARVYGSGQHHGVPYYTMELIGGMHLDEYAAEHKLTVRETLALMRSVCRAVHYAHQRGIIHRDLKPSNVMVDRDGQPHVMDFGLAIEEERGISVTEERGAGTVLYMSPEQAGGRTKQLTTQSDVYSLGVMLYELLTGKHPHFPARELLQALPAHEVRRHIETDEPIRPRRVCGQIDRELEALLLKALAKAPEARYASAGELAADIDNYLEGEPLAARKPTTAYFLRKRMRKYRLQLTLAASALAICIGGVAFYIYSIKAEQGRAHRARVREMQQRQLAELQALRANEHRRLALETLNRLVFEVQRKLSRAQGQLQLRRELIDVAVKGLKQIQAAAVDAELGPDRSLAAALLQIGDILRTAGRMPEARQAYRGALERFQALRQDSPEDVRVQHDLSVAYGRLGMVQMRAGEHTSALQHLSAALELTEQVARRSPGDRQIQQDQWALRISMGELALDTASPTAAEAHFRCAMALAEGLDSRRELSISLQRLGDVAMRRDDSAAGMVLYGRAVELGRASLADRPDDLAAKRDLSVSLAKLGEARVRAGKTAAGADDLRAALQLLEELTQHDLERFDVRADLAATSFLLAEAEAADGKAESARAGYQRAVDILATLEKEGKLEGQPKHAALLAKARARLAAEDRSDRPEQ